VRPSYDTNRANILAVARSFQCSPAEVMYQWPYYLYLDALESMHVDAEKNARIQRAQEET